MFNTIQFNKKKHFKAMVASADKVIAELEFKKFTCLIERENVRRQYDQLKDTLARIDAQLLSTPNDEKLTAEKGAVEKNIKDAQQYMDDIDGTIGGTAPTPSLPDGARGLDNEMKEWVNKRNYITSFIKHNC